MKKLRLNLNDLKVSSFVTTPETTEDGRGTVFARTTFPTGCPNNCSAAECTQVTACPTCFTCATCGGDTCGDTCNGTCLDQSCTCSLYPNCPTDAYHEQCDG